MPQVPRSKRLWGAAAALIVVAIVTWEVPGRLNRRGLPAAPVFAMAALAETRHRVARTDSVIVFAAHPDDEIIGAGGLIHAAVLAGARVQVVIFTNGDGYIKGVVAGFRTLLTTPDRFVQYGRRRQQEAIAAAERVGLSADHLTFLGYPDRGLAVLWGPDWDCRHLYTSPYTRRNRSPYARAYRPGISYCGQHVLEDVDSLLRRERPTIIVSHHPDDTHQDHWAAGQFVVAALERLRAQDIVWTRTVRVWSYLVHHGGWPRPTAYAPDLPLALPADLLTARRGWKEYPLDQTDEDAKRAAIHEYRTQVQVLRAYLLSFVRRNELFDVLPWNRPALVGNGGLPFAAQENWDRLTPIVRGVPQDLLARATGSSASLDSVAVAQDPARVYVAVRLRRTAIREAQYRVVMELLYGDGHAARLRLLFRVPRSLDALRSQSRDLPLPPGAAARSVGRRIDIVLPLAGLGRPAGLLLHVETIGPLGTPAERSPWALIHLDPAQIGAVRQVLAAHAAGEARRAPAELAGPPRGLIQ